MYTVHPQSSFQVVSRRSKTAGSSRLVYSPDLLLSPNRLICATQVFNGFNNFVMVWQIDSNLIFFRRLLQNTPPILTALGLYYSKVWPFVARQIATNGLNIFLVSVHCDVARFRIKPDR
jgi:hypothetical protein